MPPKLVSAALFATLTAFPVQGAVCTLTPEQAYQSGLERAWNFYCHDFGLLVFDGAKRVGCLARTGAQSSMVVRGAFFCRPGGFRNGWRLDSFKVAGGAWTELSQQHCVVRFSFRVNGFFKEGRRALSELRLKKDGGDCSKVLAEAF